MAIAVGAIAVAPAVKAPFNAAVAMSCPVAAAFIALVVAAITEEPNAPAVVASVIPTAAPISGANCGATTDATSPPTNPTPVRKPELSVEAI